MTRTDVSRPVSRVLWIGCLLTLLLASGLPRGRAGDTPEDSSIRLAYRFTAGEAYRVKVTHLAKVDTKISGVSEQTQTRAVSTKVWQIEEVDEDGNITFVYQVEAVSMWQQVSGRPEIRYDSDRDEVPPPEYRQLAETVGVPIARVKMDPSGHVLERENVRAQFSSSIGQLALQLPDKPLQVGEQWSHEEEVPIRLRDGTVKRIKTRELFTLEKFQAGVATISLKTQLLTPVNEPEIQSQLVQRIKRGEIKFDVDAGHILSQQMDVDETVIGFNGPDSIMKYLSRLTEESAGQETVAAGPAQPVR
jgi:hypothetical protein